MEINSHINQHVESSRFWFGEFEFDSINGCLIKGDVKTKLEPQINQLLILLVENAGKLVSKGMILDALWDNRVISNDAFRAVFKKLRKYLNDDARQPIYIQTVPLKGYKFIAEVKLQQVKEKKKSYKALIGIGLAIVSLIVFSIFKFSIDQSHSVTKLTSIDGSELKASYNAKINQFIFSQRKNKDDFLQLYTQSLETGYIKRLTFDNANFANGHLSPDATQLAFTRSSPASSTTYIADFSVEEGLTNMLALPQEVSNARYLQSWNHDGTGLYLSDLNQLEASKGIWLFDIATQTLSSVTSPNAQGQGDFFARESHDGQYLALLRNNKPGDNELVIQHLKSGSLVHIKKLPKAYSQLVWSNNDDRIILSSFYSEFAEYQISSKQLKEVPLSLPNVNNVFYSCGEECVFARQHSGNYSDLEITPNPFSDSKVAMFPHSQNAGAEDLPVIGPVSGRLYFINKQHNESQVVVTYQNDIKVLKRFPINSEFQALQIDESESYLAGIINNRLFIIDVKSERFDFVTSELDNVVSLLWTLGKERLRFARLEYGKPVLYYYDLEDKTMVREHADRFAQVPLQNNRQLIVDVNLDVWIFSEDSAPIHLTKLPHSSPNRWKVRGNFLYITERQENLTYLTRIELQTAIRESKLLAKNRFKINFDLSSDERTLLSVRSVLAQSDLVRIEY